MLRKNGEERQLSQQMGMNQKSALTGREIYRKSIVESLVA
jgi:hypothetical protein